MDLSGISKYYRLKDLVVTPEQLLLDPHNPRIAIDVTVDVSYTTDELASDAVQNYILSIINKSEHHVADLVNNMRKIGFHPVGNHIIVKHVKGNKYLVLEGNRRLTAIKHLLNERDQLQPEILRTFKELEVKEFIYKDNPRYNETEIIEILLGVIHIEGPLDWGPIERALYVYKGYMRRLEEQYDCQGQFEYIPALAKEVAGFFNFTQGEVRKMLIVYSIFDQLRQHEYNVKADDYTLIELSIGSTDLRRNYFGFDEICFSFSTLGLEKFSNLCLVNNQPINNPKEFKWFAKIYKEGTDYEVNLVENNSVSIDKIFARMQSRLKKRKFLDQLEKIRDLLKNLEILQSQGVTAETKVVKQIKALVDDKLVPLMRQGTELKEEFGSAFGGSFDGEMKVAEEPPERPMAKKLNMEDFKQLILTGKKKGYLTYDEVVSVLPADLVSSEKIKKVMIVLDKLDIKIVDSSQKTKEGTEITAGVQDREEKDRNGKEKENELSEDVKAYIRKKIIKLGAIEEVNELYHRDAAVDVYARYIAPKVLAGREH